MAFYTVTDYETVEDSVSIIMAAFETKLETLDSTNNPIKFIKIEPLPNGSFKGIIIYD